MFENISQALIDTAEKQIKDYSYSGITASFQCQGLNITESLTLPES